MPRRFIYNNHNVTSAFTTTTTTLTPTTTTTTTIINPSNIIWKLNSADSLSYPTTGNTWYDLSTNVKNVTLTNVTYTGSTQVLRYTATSVATSSLITTQKSGMSIECVFKTSDYTTGLQCIFYNGADGGSDNNGYGIFINQGVGTGLDGSMWILYGGIAWYDTTVNLGNNWYHLVFTIQSDYKPKVWLDNVNIYTYTGVANTPATPTKNTGVGYGVVSTNDRIFRGDYTICNVYNRVLTDIEISALYNQNKR